MRSRKIALYIPHPLWDAFEKHAREVGYTDAKQLLVWCAFYSLVVGKQHHITAPIAQAPRDVQDLFIEDVVAAYERGETAHGSYLEHVLEDVVKRFNLPVSDEVIKAVLADAVRNRPRKKKNSPAS